MGNKYQVSAIPFDTHEQFFRAGHRFGAAPVTVTVVENPSKPYEVNAKQLQELQADQRIKVVEGDGPPAPTQSPVRDADEEQDTRGKRRG